MYAEQFNAPTWLEEPAQWLWWTMQSRINGQLENATYNLQKFWESLNIVKATATEATWPEILALDSQSHIQAANVTGAIINQMEQDANTTGAWLRFFSGTLFNGWKGGSTPQAVAIMQAQRLKELQTADYLAGQARNAMSQRVQAVAENRISQEAAERAIENTTLENIIKNDTTFLGVPLWAWALGGLGIFALLVRR